jgi:flagellar motility protein MotE (MotC chaperone)
MATSPGQKIKHFLAAGEVAMKTANTLDEHYAEFATLEVRLQDLRNELAEAEQRLSETREETTKAGAELRRAQEVLAAQTDKNNQELGRQQAQLRALEQRHKDTQANFDNLLAGLRALHERIGVG